MQMRIAKVSILETGRSGMYAYSIKSFTFVNCIFFSTGRELLYSVPQPFRSGVAPDNKIVGKTTYLEVQIIFSLKYR